MLIGAHVSPAGGLPKAVERGLARGCAAIQVFGQSPRAWKPTMHSEEQIAAFRQAMAESSLAAVVIHAVYLLNCASEDREIRAKSLQSLIHCLRLGHAIGARAVILHPGSAKQGAVPQAVARAGATISAALAESEDCALHLENTAGAGGTLGRSIDELASLLEEAGGDPRLGLCLDSCHLFASGYDIRTPAGIDAVLAEIAAKIGLQRIGSLHLNDSLAGLGSNRDRHANIGQGELGARGCAAFLAAPAFEQLVCVLETPGENREGPAREEIALATVLRARGVRARRRRSLRLGDREPRGG